MQIVASILAHMAPPTHPVALGVLYCDPAPTYESLVHGQVAAAKAKSGQRDLNTLLRRGHTWVVKPNGAATGA